MQEPTRLLTNLTLLFAADLALPVVLILHQGAENWSETLSGLGARGGPYPQIVSVWLISFGIGLGILALVQRKVAPKGWFGLLLWAVGGGIVCGIFPEDPIGAAETISGKLHGVGAGIGSIALLAIAPLHYSEVQPGWHRHVLLFLILASIFGFIAFLTNGRSGGLVGHWQRFYLTVTYMAVVSALWLSRE